MQGILLNVSSKVGFIKDAFFRSFQSLFKQLIILLPSLLLVKYINEKSYGIFSMVIGIATITVSFSDFGITIIALKELIQSKDTEEKKQILGSSLFVPLLLSIFFSIITFLYLSSKVEFTLIFLCITLIIVSPFYLILDSFLRSTLQFKRLSQRTIISATISISLQGILFNLFGINGVMTGIIFFYLSFTFLNINTLIEYCGKPNLKIIKRILKKSIFIGLGTIGFLLFARFDIIIFSKYNLINEIGYYEYINKIFEVLAYPFAILAQVLTPRLISKDKSSTSKIYNQIILGITVCTIILALLIHWLLPFYNTISPYFKHESFKNAFGIMNIVYPFRVLVIFHAQTFFIIQGKEKEFLYIILGMGLLSFVSNLTIIPSYGIEGAYYTSLTVSIITLLMQSIVVHKTHLKLR